MLKNKTQRLLICILLCVVAIVLFAQSNSDKVKICGTWTASQTQKSYWGTDQIDVAYRFSIGGACEISYLVNGSDGESKKGSYSIKNDQLILELDGQTGQGSYSIVGDCLTVDNQTLTKQAEKGISLSEIMKIAAGVVALISIILLRSIGKKESNEDDVIPS